MSKSPTQLPPQPHGVRLRGRGRRARARAVGGLCAAAVVAVLSGCRETAAIDPPAPAPPDLSGLLPVPGRHLDRAVPSNRGLLTVLGTDGTPTRHGEVVDPLVIESRRFYDTLGSPSIEVQSLDYPDPFTGQPPGLGKSAPLTFATWKTVFGFPERLADESLEAYRQKHGIVVYYNRNELGLGRELGCSSFIDGQDAAGAPLLGLACFVTNFGASFQDEARALTMALEGSTPRNTVCITYRPTMEPGYQVQFYAYGPDGRRQEWAQLDNMGPRPHPQVCINCHGGSYDASKHLAFGARFLPLDPNLVVFSKDASSRRDRAAQEEAIRRINSASLRTPLTPAQEEMLDRLYLGGVHTPGVSSQAQWAPAGWQDSPADRQLYDKVVKPYCATCHLALDAAPAGRRSLSHELFSTAGAFRRFPMSTVMCGTFSMPNAQPTLMGLWDTGRGPIDVAGTAYPSAADALLGAFGLSRNECVGLQEQGTCNRGDDPDSLCGNAQSGMACNRASGRCVPDVATMSDPAAPRGYCRTDGSRTCPATLTCRPMVSAVAGLESFDGACLP